jgi:hypothetical protein
MAAGSTYTPIANYTAPSTITSYTFTSIPLTYTDLILVTNFQSTSTGDSRCSIRVGNGSVDTGSNYSLTIMVGDGSTASSSRETNRTNFDSYLSEGETGTNTFTLNTFHFMNYSNTTTNKTVLIRENNPTAGGSSFLGTAASVGLYRSTVALNTIQIFDLTGKSIAAGSTFTLYGIAAA